MYRIVLYDMLHWKHAALELVGLISNNGLFPNAIDIQPDYELS